MANTEDIEREIERHRSAIAELEAQRGTAVRTWPPQGFYLTFYIVAGTIIGILGSVTSFLFHIVGSLLVRQDPARYFVPAYMGVRGWVGIRLDGDIEWDALEQIARDSHAFTSPRRATASKRRARTG